MLDLEMEGASKDREAGSDGAVGLALEDGRERVPVAIDRGGNGGCPAAMVTSESGFEGIGVFNDATRRSDRALKQTMKENHSRSLEVLGKANN